MQVSKNNPADYFCSLAGAPSAGARGIAPCTPKHGTLSAKAGKQTSLQCAGDATALTLAFRSIEGDTKSVYHLRYYDQKKETSDERLPFSFFGGVRGVPAN